MANYRRKRVVRKKRTTTARRNRNLKKRYYRKVRKVNKKPKLTVQRLKSWTPDVMLTKFKASSVIRNFRMVDIDEANQFIFSGFSPGEVVPNPTPATSLAIMLCLNPRPNQGRYYFAGRSSGQYGGGATSPFYYDAYPNEMLATTYNSYRPYGMKVRLTITPADSPEIGATGVNGPTEIFGTPNASPVKISTTPFQIVDTGRGAYWDGNITPVALSCNTIPMTKYGKSYSYSGAGGNAKKVIHQYYDVAKVYGLTREQFMTNDNTKCRVPLGNDPSLPNPVMEAWLMISIGEYCTDAFQTRYCNVQIDTVSYGRWEGPAVNTYL